MTSVDEREREEMVWERRRRPEYQFFSAVGSGHSFPKIATRTTGEWKDAHVAKVSD